MLHFNMLIFLMSVAVFPLHLLTKNPIALLKTANGNSSIEKETKYGKNVFTLA